MHQYIYWPADVPRGNNDHQRFFDAGVAEKVKGHWDGIKGFEDGSDADRVRGAEVGLLGEEWDEGVTDVAGV